MSNKIYGTIKIQQNPIDTFREMKRKGLVQSWSVEKIDELLSRKEFPIQIPVELDLDDLLLLMDKPVVKKLIRPKVDNAVGVCLRKILEAG